MQSCTAYRRSRKTDGLKHRRRSQHTGASDRHGDVCKLCEFGLGREFVSHSPLRRFRPLAEITPPRKGIKLYDNAVNIIFQPVAHIAELSYVRENVLAPAHRNTLGDHRKPKLGKAAE